MLLHGIYMYSLRFGDLYGGRAALTLAFISSALSYGLLGMANSIPMLFISRLPSLFMHAMQGRYSPFFIFKNTSN